MKRKASDELEADRPPPLPREMAINSASPAMTTRTGTVSTPTTTTTTRADTTGTDRPGTDRSGTDPHPWSDLPPDDSIDDSTLVTSASPASPPSVSGLSAPSGPSAPSAPSAVTATTAASRRFPSDLKTIRCTWPDCHKAFNRPARLTAHMRSHTNDRPFQCPDCPKTYLEEKHLRQHVKGSHTHERRYVCAECSKAFLTATRLRRHAAVHEGQDRFRCKGYDAACTRTFRKHQTLQRHIRVDHLQQPAFCCTQAGAGPTKSHCGALFDSAGALRRHVEREHAPPKFWCEECAAGAGGGGESDSRPGFATKQLLESHMRHHHANCLFCDARCAGPAELLKHVDMHHSGKTVADRKTIVCPHAGCGKTFTRRANRNVHIRAAHEGLRFVCGTSGRGGGADIEPDDIDVDADDDDDDDGGGGIAILEPTGSARLEIAAWNLRNEGCGRGFVSKMKLEEHIWYVHLGHDRPAPGGVVVGSHVDSHVDGHVDNNNDAAAAAAQSNIIEALLGTNRTLACTMPGCPARFVRHHDLNTHIQRDHFVVNDGGSAGSTGTVYPVSDVQDAFWMGGGDGGGGDVDVGVENTLLPAGDDMFGTFIDMNAGLLGTDDVQWQMNEAEMRRLIGSEGSAGVVPAENTAFIDPDLFL